VVREVFEKTVADVITDRVHGFRSTIEREVFNHEAGTARHAGSQSVGERLRGG
jgi:hypothetical protein